MLFYIISICKYFSEVSPIIHASQCLEAEMVHFIHQMQYFITFEVHVPCSFFAKKWIFIYFLQVTNRFEIVLYSHLIV